MTYVEALRAGYNYKLMGDKTEKGLRDTVTCRGFVENNIDFRIVRYPESDKHPWIMLRKSSDFWWDAEGRIHARRDRKGPQKILRGRCRRKFNNNGAY